MTPEDSEESSVLCAGMGEECRCKSLIKEPLVHPQVDRMMQYEWGFFYYSLLYLRENKALLVLAYTYKNAFNSKLKKVLMYNSLKVRHETMRGSFAL